MTDRAFASTVLIVGSVLIGYWEWHLRREAAPGGGGDLPAWAPGAGDVVPRKKGIPPVPPELGFELGESSKNSKARREFDEALRRDRLKRGQTPGINPRPFSAERALSALGGGIWS